MHTILRVSAFTLIVLLVTQTGSAGPPVRLVSPAVAVGSETVVCQVVNTDSSPHSIQLTFYNAAGAPASFTATVIVQPNGSNGLGLVGANKTVHCEIIADGKADLYRATIEIRNGSTTVMALPIS